MHSDNANAPKLAYSIKEACKATSLGRTHIFYLIRNKKLDVVRIGRRTLVKAESLALLMNCDN